VAVLQANSPQNLNVAYPTKPGLSTSFLVVFPHYCDLRVWHNEALRHESTKGWPGMRSVQFLSHTMRWRFTLVFHFPAPTFAKLMYSERTVDDAMVSRTSPCRDHCH
jgi:hypothetical protein